MFHESYKKGKLQKIQLWRIGKLLPTKFQEVPLVS